MSQLPVLSQPPSLDDNAGAKPFVRETMKLRSLHFNHKTIESCMAIANPDALHLEYTRLMMGFLLFNAQPARVTMVGLGGGSLAKFCHRHLPGAQLVVIENNPDVISLRGEFLVPPDGPRLSVINDEAAEYFKRQTAACCDVLLVDGFSGGGVPDALSSQQFYDDCRRALSTDGILVANLHHGQPDFEQRCTRIQNSFGEPLQVRGSQVGNCIVFAGGANFTSQQHIAAVRRPKTLDRVAWAQLKPAFARVVSARKKKPTA